MSALGLLFLLLAGLAYPQIFSKLLGKTPSRLHITAVLLPLFVAAAVVAFRIEPAGIRIIPRTSPTPAQNQKLLEDGSYQVAEVVDGDTIKIKAAADTETVRLIGIDAPEAIHPDQPPQCFNAEATEKARQLLNGQQVRLEADPSQDNRDAYGRWLRYVFLADGTNFNQLMIAEGYARESTFISTYRYQDEFKQAQQTAQANQMGLWSPGTCGQ